MIANSSPIHFTVINGISYQMEIMAVNKNTNAGSEFPKFALFVHRSMNFWPRFQQFKRIGGPFQLFFSYVLNYSKNSGDAQNNVKVNGTENPIMRNA